MDIMKYVTEQALILIPVLYTIGNILKNSDVKDKLIPWILLILGILGNLALGGLNINSIIQGVLVAGATVFTNQIIKQTTKEE